MKCRDCEFALYHFSYDDHSFVVSECLHHDRPDDCCFNTDPNNKSPIWCPLLKKKVERE